VFQTTRSAVRTKSSNKQRPREDNGLEEQIYLNGRGSAVAAPIEKESGIQSTSIRLELTGVPAGAKVTLDGTQLRGNVFTDDIVDKAKTIEVAVVANGFKPYVHNVVIPRGGNVIHAVTLEAKPKPANRLTEFPALKAYVESLCVIPAGTFQMGEFGRNPFDGETPIHIVTLSSFSLGSTPVTFGMWKEYCTAVGKNLPKAPSWVYLLDHPVVNVSWNDIMGGAGNRGYVGWASDVAGIPLSLPTEAQFEYGARGGQQGLEYPWGNNFDESLLWCSNRTKRSKTAPVLRNENIFRNQYGLTDMIGNVGQWCLDLFVPYGNAAQIDPQGPSSNSDNRRVLRGGSWVSRGSEYFGCGRRGRIEPSESSSIFGFRLAT
jgi:formylglycine-generating enzyme required for sulfatase activity